jgi:hypothetical protein
MTLSAPCFGTFFGVLIGQLIASVMSNVFITDVQAAIEKQFNISMENTKITYFHQNFIIRFTSPQIQDLSFLFRIQDQMYIWVSLVIDL